MDLFAEVRVPLLQDMFMADSLLLNASYRFSDYSNPIDEIDQHLRCRPRVGADRFAEVPRQLPALPCALRASSSCSRLSRLGLYDNDNDPCAGRAECCTLDGSASAPKRAARRVTVRFDLILDNSAGQYNGFFGGNPDLAPETADSYTVGFVLHADLPGRASA